MKLYHLEKLPDANYNDRTISLENLNGTTYKKLVNTTSCIKKNKFNEVDTSYIIMHNYNKAKYITDNKLKEVDYNYEQTMEVLKSNLKNNFVNINN